MNPDQINVIKAEKYDRIREIFAEHKERMERALGDYQNNGETEPFWDTDYPGWAVDAHIDWEELLDLLED